MSNDWTPEPLPCHTPVPHNVDTRIDRQCLELAECRSDLSPADKRMLREILAYRVRTFKRVNPHS